MSKLTVLNRLTNIIESTLKFPADKIDVDAHLESLGINSLIMMELIENIDQTFGVTLTPALIVDVSTLSELAELLEGMTACLTDEVQEDSSRQVASAKQTESSPDVLGYVSQKYSVDLSDRGLDSVDEIVDALLADHSGDLLRHYGILPTQVPHGRPKTHDIAIVGISCRLPDAPDASTFWDNLISQRNSIRELPKTRWNWEDYYSETPSPGKTVSKWGALVDDVDCFDADFFDILGDEATTIDPQLRLLLEETYHAVEDAGMDMKMLAGSRTGVFIGYEYSEYEHRLRKLNNNDFSKGPLFSSSSPSYYLSNRISHTFDLCGPSESFNVNCASSAVAINRAYYSLMNGESDIAIAGAASLNLFADDYIAASQYGVLSPNGTSGVFDDDANGFTRGEGVATIVLKRLEDAEKNNDHIYAVIKSSHANYRGAARHLSEVKHEAITSVLSECYEKAAVDLETIHYIEVDGYARKWADSFEYEGIKGVFANSKAGAKHVALGSMKGNIGNVEPVSGIANVIKLALSLHYKKFPATISKKKINTFIDIDNASHPLYIADKEISFESIRKDAGKPIRAGVNSFADSGTNVHILLEEYIAPTPLLSDVEATKQLFVLSAKDSKRLESYVQKYIDFLSNDAGPQSFSDLIYTSQVGRQSLNARLAIVASSRKDLLDKLNLVSRAGIKEKFGLDFKEIYFGQINPSEKSMLASLITADMAHMQLMQSMQSTQWKQVAMLWVNGVAIPWSTVWQSHPVQRISLPTYPFAKERYWLEVESQVVDIPAMVKASGIPEKVIRKAKKSALEKESVLISDQYFFVHSDALNVQIDAVAMSASEKIELFLKQAIAAQQHKSIDDISLDINFIELGMSSIDVADLIIKLDKLLQTHLSPSVFFKYSEVGTLSDYLAVTYAEVIDSIRVTKVEPALGQMTLADEIAASSPLRVIEQEKPSPLDFIVPLQAKGDKLPIFAVPGAGGNALSLQQLSHALGNKQPLYCLEPVGLDGNWQGMTSVEEIADFNISALKSIHGTGPYRLLGYSNGGVVAFEMARKLLEQGEKVSSLMMLDTLAPSLLSKDQIEVMMVAVFNRFINSLGAVSGLDVEQLKQVPEEMRIDYLYNYAFGLGLELPKQQFSASFKVATASERGARAYRPTKLLHKVDLTLFRAANGFENMPDDYGWREFLSGDLHTYHIDANHFTIVEKGPVNDVAERINQVPTKSPKKMSKDRAGVAA